MRKSIIFCIVLFTFPIVNAVCIAPNEIKEIKEDVVFCYGIFNLESGMNIVGNNIAIDCGNSALIGNGLGYGILLKDRNNVVVQNCNISNYEIGIYLENTNNSFVNKNHLTKNKFGIALFNSFNNNLDNNLLYENINDNEVSYFQSFPIQGEEPSVEKKEEISTPQQIMEGVIKVKNPFLNENEILDEVNFIFSKYFIATQDNLEISRTVFYNESDKSTTIVLHLKPKKILLNLSVYEKIPKCVSSYVNQLLFETADYEVINNDPLILWTFSRLENEKEISYKVFKKIDEECKNLLAAFGIATGFEEFKNKEGIAKEKEQKNVDYLLIFSIIIIIVVFIIVRLYLFKPAKK